MAAPTSLLVLLYLPARHNTDADNDVSRHTELEKKTYHTQCPVEHVQKDL